MLKCPKCKNSEILVTVEVKQEWELDSDGNVLEITNDCVDILKAPEDAETLTCKCCNYSGPAKDFSSHRNKEIPETLEFFGQKYSLRRSTYQNNNTLAVLIVDEYGNDSVITTNLDTSDFLCNENTAFVDTNNLPDIEKWLTDNNIAQKTGLMASSGFCEYPLYIFNVEHIPEINIETEKDIPGETKVNIVAVCENLIKETGITITNTTKWFGDYDINIIISGQEENFNKRFEDIADFFNLNDFNVKTTTEIKEYLLNILHKTFSSEKTGIERLAAFLTVNEADKGEYDENYDPNLTF